MSMLKPKAIFLRLSKEIPTELQKQLIVTGSLAAAYHFSNKLKGQAVNTKDADLVVHPAGNVTSCKEMTNHLLSLGWRRKERCIPQAKKEPVNKLEAIRLYPPTSKTYFIEFLNLPRKGQTHLKRWVPMRLADGWYGLPSFKYMGLVAEQRLKSEVGIEYASPAMMALANLLAHQSLGTARIESGDMEGLLRSAKDLGRVIALALLSGREDAEAWLDSWVQGLKKCFPKNHAELARNAGDGLGELLNDQAALAEAQQTTEIGLLSGMKVTAAMLKATGERLLVDVIEPLAERFA